VPSKASCLDLGEALDATTGEVDVVRDHQRLRSGQISPATHMCDLAIQRTT
jgi:hypothetical protein